MQTINTIPRQWGYIKRVRRWLNNDDRTKSWLARKCNVSPAAVTYWFDLKNYPSRKHRVIIKKITGIEE